MPNTSLDGQAPQYLDIDKALEQIGDVPALHDMLDMLQTSLTRDIPEIERFLSADQVPQANRVLHALKGFIPIFCTDDLSSHVAAVEVLSKIGTAQEVSAAYRLLRPKLEKLQIEIDANIDG